MKPIVFTIDNMGFASSTLSSSHLNSIKNIAKQLMTGTEDVPLLDDAERIVLTGYSSGTKNLEQHAMNRASVVRQALEANLRNLGALPPQLAKISIAVPVTQLVASAAQSSGKDRKVEIAIFVLHKFTNVF
jgi:hypothetical protein